MLVHVGVHKTGTTAIQHALRRGRRALARHGVVVPRATVSAHEAARGLIGYEMGWERTQSKADRDVLWRDYAASVRGCNARVAVVSSEVLCQADPDRAAQVVTDLGGDRVHVIVGLRALGTALPSAWQQYVKTGLTMPYESWLHEVLGDPGGRTTSTPSFWRRYDVAAVLERWLSVLDPSRLTVVVTDADQPAILPAAFEQRLELPQGLLVRKAARAVSNRALTAAEAELLRQVNEVARDQVTSSDYVRLIRKGAGPGLGRSRTPSRDEPRLGLPSWAREPVRELAEHQVEAVRDLRRSGVSVVGSPTGLLRQPTIDLCTPPETMPLEAAVVLVRELVDVAARGRDSGEPEPEAFATAAHNRPREH